MVAMTHIEQVFLVHSTTLLHTRQTYATYLPMQIHSQQAPDSILDGCSVTWQSNHLGMGLYVIFLKTKSIICGHCYPFNHSGYSQLTIVSHCY